ncbi:MAG: lipopolysaccharide biosynthesis protein [Phycisphaerales bacterium]|nr:lipopolysaccharide biosynthesis protein [Phycisphaerales bacterium]
MTSLPTAPLDDAVPAAPGSAAVVPQAALGHIAASGFAWNVVVTITNKVVGFAAAVVFARLLLKDDFGQYYKSLITLSLVSAIRDSVLSPVLLGRQKHLDRWENAGFWCSVALGVVAAVVMAGVGLRFYFTPGGQTVAKLLWIAAAGSPFIAAGMVSTAKLQAQLRFRLVAQMGAVTTLVATVASLIMAAPPFRCGAYSLMVPAIAVAVIRSCAVLVISPPAVQWKLEWSKWLSLGAAGAMIAYSAFGWQFVGTGDNFVISLRFGDTEVGLYGYVFNQSIQIITVLAASLGSVLLPTLARLNEEPARQIDAYLRVCRVLATVGVPFCVMQGIFARPMFQPVFGHQWGGAESIMEILSVGMAFAVVNSCAAYVLQARQQLRVLALWTTACIGVFFAFVVIGVWIGGVLGVASAVSAFHIIMGSFGMWIVMRPYGTVRDLIGVFSAPILASIAAALPVLTLPLLSTTIYHGQSSLLVTVPVICVYAIVFVVVYTAVLGRLSPEMYKELVGRLGFVGRRLGLV